MDRIVRRPWISCLGSWILDPGSRTLDLGPWALALWPPVRPWHIFLNASCITEGFFSKEKRMSKGSMSPAFARHTHTHTHAHTHTQAFATFVTSDYFTFAFSRRRTIYRSTYFYYEGSTAIFTHAPLFFVLHEVSALNRLKRRQRNLCFL